MCLVDASIENRSIDFLCLSPARYCVSSIHMCQKNVKQSSPLPRKCSLQPHSTQQFQPNKQIKIKSNSFSTLKNCISFGKMRFCCVFLAKKSKIINKFVNNWLVQLEPSMRNIEILKSKHRKKNEFELNSKAFFF